MTLVQPAVRLATMSLVCLAACGDAQLAGETDASVPREAHVVLDASAVDAQLTTPQDDGSTSPDATLVAYVPPTVQFPSDAPNAPFALSELGLYMDMASKALAPDLVTYEPGYALWSDGAQKTRWLRLPAGTAIDNGDHDHWQFPVGTVLFKEFALEGKKLETRVLARTGPGERDYFFGAFVWRDDESDAVLAWEGARNVRGSQHDVPSVKQCGTCHNGEPGRVLGFSAVQLPQVAAPLVVPVAAPYRVPGTEVEASALGYLHANCGHCHNPSGTARPDSDLNLRLAVAQQTVAETNAVRSTAWVALQSFQANDFALRIVPGQPAQSGLYFRMTQRGPTTQMPPFGSERADELGLGRVYAFISALPTEDGQLR